MREGGAVALKKFCTVYSDKVPVIYEELKKGLAAVKEQPENSTLNENMDKLAKIDKITKCPTLDNNQCKKEKKYNLRIFLVCFSRQNTLNANCSFKIGIM